MTDDERRFRDELRSWLDRNLPTEWRSRHPKEPWTDERRDLARRWQAKLAEGRYVALDWPVSWGGRDASIAERILVNTELLRARAPRLIGHVGLDLVGPAIIEHGTEEQKRRHLEPIRTASELWCQGFSEPGAGSDLASLQTRAEDKGDQFLVNGQKIWTSGAQWADMIFCLVRTDTTKKHEGISFVVFSMRQPGVEVRPIRLIAGNSPFCETFITDVKVPKDDLVGPLNGGWSVAKRLLQHERSGMDGARRGPGKKVVLGQVAKAYVGEDDQGRLADPDLRTRIIMNEMDQAALQATVRRAALEARGNAGPSATTSIMKNANMKIAQDRAELTLEFMGSQGLGWQGEGFSADELSAVRGWLSGKAGSIYGGSNEVQSNIISKRILGLPDLTQSR
ncbi:MAG: acyl-CoA dehydrogenase family protein [Phenylobacterium sp.]